MLSVFQYLWHEYRLSYSNVFEGLPNLIVSLQKVIAKATEVFFQVLFCFEFQYCVIKQKSWIFVQPFYIEHLFVLLSNVPLYDLKAFTVAPVDRSRDELDILQILVSHRMEAIMSHSQNPIRTNKAASSKDCESSVYVAFDDSHG